MTSPKRKRGERRNQNCAHTTEIDLRKKNCFRFAKFFAFGALRRATLSCANCASKVACSCAVTCAVSAAAHEGNPGWSFSMVSEPFSEKFGSPSVGRWSCRFPSSDMARLWAQPFFIRDRWRLKEVGPHL